MAWRPNQNLIEGELDNTTRGTVTGWMTFFRQDQEPLKVELDLAGDCHRDLQGKKFRISNPNPCDRANGYMEGFDPLQKGTAGDITAGDEPRDYVDYPYIEWYSDGNGRVVLELERSQLEILDEKPRELEQLDRTKQHDNMKGFLKDMVDATHAQFGGVVGDAPLDANEESPPRSEASTD